jgi:hypothetical protein
MNRNPEPSRILASGDGWPRNFLSRLKRKGRIALGVVVALIVANYAPLLNTHAEQDNCVFGPVSNAQYRAYLARAKTRLTFSFYADQRALAFKLNDLFTELAATEPSIYSRLAIMHAMLRAIGAEYRNTNGNDVSEGPSDPYAKALTRSWTVSFNYVLDVNRLWIFLPWPRESWILGLLAGPLYSESRGPPYPEKRGEVAFIAHGPNLIDNPIDRLLKPDGLCPRVPSPDLADNFSLKSD